MSTKEGGGVLYITSERPNLKNLNRVDHLNLEALNSNTISSGTKTMFEPRLIFEPRLKVVEIGLRLVTYEATEFK